MKKVIAILLTLATLLSAFSLCTFALSENALVLGDSNRDLKVNVKDATFIQKYLAKIVSFDDDNLLCSDCNSDEKVNIKDATWIQKFIANIDCPFDLGSEIQKPTIPAETTETTQPTVETHAPETLPTEDLITEPTEVTTAQVTEITTASTDPTEEISTTSSAVVTTQADVTEPTEIITETTTVVPTESEAATVAPYNPVKPDTNITIYFSNNVGWSTVNAYFYNEEKQLEMKSWPGAAMTHYTTNDFGEKIYAIDVDVSIYNRVVFNNGRSQTLNAAVTVASSGFFVTSQTPKSAMQLGVYAYGETDYGTKKTVHFDYPSGYKKPVEIWTPAGYDPADTSKKYSVIYLLDGQNQFDDSDAYNGGWGSDEVITALMKNGGEGIILVGIDNQRNRDNELTPDLGEVIPAYNNGGFKNGSGEQFAEFVAKTVVPFVEANYNVYTDAAHSAIVGSSSGGIEAFYIGMEYMEEFGRIGAISPAFLLYDKATWYDYLSKFDFTEPSNLPRIYFYNGGGDSLELELLPNAKDMKSWLADLGYDESKMTFVYDEKNGHNEAAWRNVMPEIVTWLFELQ
ncbi:MAG: starch-binding protein [Clostridia bacterium]|nr:starch-binding protein [Clostridia bacterium]